jgi:hypothetical protein
MFDLSSVCHSRVDRRVPLQDDDNKILVAAAAARNGGKTEG